MRYGCIYHTLTSYVDLAAGGVMTQARRWDQKLVGGLGVLLIAAVWISSGLFGAYILGFYLGAVGDRPEQWNETLPRLYEARTPLANVSMGVHFLTGAILLLAGPLQLIEGVRDRFRPFHRWLGRIYVVAALLAGLGGLVFILIKGTVGGTVMNIGFGLYGALMVLAAVQAWRHAAARRIEIHKAWALRLFALTVGSWLYRMDYGFWLLLTDGLGHLQNFEGPFDKVMAFFFYIPNLIVAELFIRARRKPASMVLNLLAVLGLVVAIGLTALGTYYFTLYYWWPGIMSAFK